MSRRGIEPPSFAYQANALPLSYRPRRSPVELRGRIGLPGFEPGLLAYETSVLPLNDSPWRVAGESNPRWSDLESDPLPGRNPSRLPLRLLGFLLSFLLLPLIPTPTVPIFFSRLSADHYFPLSCASNAYPIFIRQLIKPNSIKFFDIAHVAVYDLDPFYKHDVVSFWLCVIGHRSCVSFLAEAVGLEPTRRSHTLPR